MVKRAVPDRIPAVGRFPQYDIRQTRRQYHHQQRANSLLTLKAVMPGHAFKTKSAPVLPRRYVNGSSSGLGRMVAGSVKLPILLMGR